MDERVEALIREAMACPVAPGLRNWHNFDNGIYQRGCIIPAGVLAVGARHMTRNIFALVKGTMVFCMPDGELKEVTAPWCQVCEVGVHRVGYAVTECIAMNLHDTIATTPEEAEAILIYPEDNLVLTEDRKERNELSCSGSAGPGRHRHGRAITDGGGTSLRDGSDHQGTTGRTEGGDRGTQCPSGPSQSHDGP